MSTGSVLTILLNKSTEKQNERDQNSGYELQQGATPTLIHMHN